VEYSTAWRCIIRFDCPGVHRKVSRNDREDDHGEEGEESDEGKEEIRCSKKDDEEICREEVGQEDCGGARSRQGACQEGQGRQISGRQANCQEGAGADPNGTAKARRSAVASGSSSFACGAEARNAGRTSRAQAGSAAAEFRRSGGPNWHRQGPRRSSTASGSSGFACGAEARNAGPAFGSQ
jgi:hypothetical protein